MASTVTLTQLRRYAIARSLFAPTGLAAAIDALGFVQADPIRAPARAQDLTLRHRVVGYRARIYTYNITVFDPTWFTRPRTDIAARLARQREQKDDARIRHATEGYLDFLRLGGRLRLASLSHHLLGGILRRRLPILTGLSSTYLYRSARESEADGVPDDIRGQPVGHFVVIAGWDDARRRVLVVDPYQPNPYGPAHEYWISVDRVLAAILLGIVTHDANLLVIYPGHGAPRR